MSETHLTLRPAPGRTAPRERTTPLGRMAALARAELSLFARNRGTLAAAVLVPLVLPFSVRSAAGQLNLKDAGLTVGLVMLPASIGFSLLFAVYSTLVGVFVSRREQLVFKRLRTGEPRDPEILAGAALPAVAIALAQCAVMAAACTVLLRIPAPHAPQFAVLGVALGVVLCGAFAAVTAIWTRTAESAQITTVPLVLLSALGSGLAIPLELLPDRLARLCELLPLTPAITLVRAGWTGDLGAGEAVRAVIVALAWTGVAVFAVRRWFRWEPRR
ncbi:ABC transporter permease [Streptomyces sp. NPDC005435]|uniref:ABC transporter permease n=1 Tax=Streptomyces sp. NPDC005435 TaxID=3154464 RepID=UPI003451D333